MSSLGTLTPASDAGKRIGSEKMKVGRPAEEQKSTERLKTDGRERLKEERGGGEEEEEKGEEEEKESIS